MTALTTRDALAKAECSCGHSVVMAHANWHDRCGHIGCKCRLSWAEALLASGAVIDAATLADDLRTNAARAWGGERMWMTTGTHVAEVAAEWVEEAMSDLTERGAQ